ncbi:pentatricopeptide repeat-containing protein At2g37310 [Andrographis paniculata]|uniref:pentatricopeptide repeat-containing protein At2g37310 n=1 Tax=Andrographis paniculata TaxID=175694 RepID=UPI0021E7CD9F|nr:pentatricopeptide repeat-containing protein At2g37310 [Andrographis paniculata]
MITAPFTRQSIQALLQDAPITNGRSIRYSLYGHLIQRCAERRLFRQAKQIHARLILVSTTADNFLASKLIAFYSRTNQLSCAHHVFDQIPSKNTFSFNALLIAYSLHSRHNAVLELFAASLPRRNEFWDLSDVKPDSFTLSCALKAMSEVAVDGPLLTRMMHCYVIKHALDFDVFVCNGLVTCYSRCDDLVSARALFDEMPERDLVSWNSMISGYSQGGFYQECKDLYKMMLGVEDLRPNGVTAVSVLHACAQSADLIFGMKVHQFVTDNGIEMDLSVCNSIIAVYAKCGSLDYARQLFEEMTEKDEITYSTIISGYMSHGHVDEAMDLFHEINNPGLSIWNAVISGKVQNNRYDMVLDFVRQMQGSGTKPNSMTLSSILPAIPHVSHLKAGKEIHAYAIKTNSDRNIYVVSAIIDVYAKLGFLSGAQKIFDLIDNRSVIAWTAIISAYASHGDAKVALSLFEEMLKRGIKPDAVTYTAVLSACAHSGLVDKAWEIFNDVLPKYGIQPLANHYSCMVACLTRAKRLSEAVEFVKKMPMEPTPGVWGALLTGASECNDIELAEFVCSHLFELEPENPTNYIVMANLYSKSGRWEEAEGVRAKMKNTGFKKIAATSRVEASGELQNLIAGGI